MKRIIYSKYSNDRNDKFNIRTDILCDENNQKSVIKTATNMESQAHIDNLVKWSQILRDKFEDSIFEPNRGKQCENGIEFEFLKGVSLSETLDEYISEDKIDEVFRLIEQYIDEIKKVYGKKHFAKDAKFVSIFGDVELPEGLMGDTAVNIDMIFPNIIVKENTWNVIDYEWTFDCNVPVNYVIYRALHRYCFLVEKRESVLGHDVYSRYGISKEEIAAYEQMEQNFMSYVYKDSESLVHLGMTISKQKIRLETLLEQNEENNQLHIVQVYLDHGNGLSEEDSYYIYTEPRENGVIELDVEFEENVKAFRIDPAQKECALEIIEFCSAENTEKKVNFITNGFSLNDNVFLFETNDPQIFVTEAVDRKVHLAYYISNIKGNIAKKVEEEIEHQVKERQKEMNTYFEEKQKMMDDFCVEKQKLMDDYLKEREKIMDKYFEEKQEYIASCEKEKQEVIDNSMVEVQRYESIIAETNNKMLEMSLTIQHLNNINAQIQSTVTAMQNSTSWKISAPVRFVGRILKQNKFTHFVGKHIKLLLRLGWKEYTQAVKESFRVKRGGILLHEDTLITPIEDTSEENVTIMSTVSSLEVCDKKIAVHVHLYYTDLLGEILGYLDNIPYTFDAYISCCEGADVKSITKRVQQLKCVNKVIVKILPNRGRDIAPLYVWFAKDVVKYDYLLHIHSKKSLYTGSERAGWRQYSLNSLLGSKEVVKKIFWLFENEERVGVAYPDNHPDVPMLAYSWLVNEGRGREFLHRLGIPFESGIFMYPAGSFFWAKIDAIKPLFDQNFTIEDFDEEAGQNDGTIAHVIERATGFIVKHRQYRSAIIDYQEGVVRWDISLKAFRPYLNSEVDAALDFLMQYEVISFDIFDTLITRGVLHPDDLFELMRLKIKSMFDLDMNLLEVRKRAEAEVNKVKGAYTNIHDIYEEFEKITGLTHEVVEQIKQLEIDLEYNLILPRKDMRKMFNTLKEAGKRIILVSDMYLTSDIIREMLRKCGYQDADEMWISCECGLRKDQDTIWNAVLAKYNGKRFIHVGDNVRSDWQTVIDRRAEAYWIMSAVDEWKLSPYYEKFRAYDNGDILNSLLLGMTLNGGLFNSPYALTGLAQPEYEDSKNWGFSVFGPMFYKFLMWVDKEVQDDGIIAFLAREGYLLEPLYKTILEHLGEEPKEHCYFLTSRRAVSVAAIKEWDDVREIISKYYRGSLSNLLKARLGLSLPKDVEDKYVMMDEELEENISEVIELLKAQPDLLFKNVDEERGAYLEYIKSQISEEDWNKITVVDVGYSGTIQYYLAKLLDEKVSGRYLSVFGNIKPEKLECSCEGLYDTKTEFVKEIQRTQLFLESVLQAPVGQLIKFNQAENGVEAVHKPDESVRPEIVDLQEGIREYCEILASALKDTDKDILDTGKLVEEIYSELINGKVMKQSLADIFTVEDDYCSNGVLRFNKATNSWE